MADEPAKPRRKRRNNRPARVDEILPWPAELTYYRSLRPLWDRNLKRRIMMPPPPESQTPQEKSP